jgi:hypothetical protein
VIESPCQRIAGQLLLHLPGLVGQEKGIFGKSRGELDPEGEEEMIEVFEDQEKETSSEEESD